MAKEVFWADKKGMKHRSILKDNQTDPRQGYILDPPNVIDLDWGQIAIDLHNQLVDRKLFTYSDVVMQQNGLTGAIISTLRKKVKRLYTEAK